MEKIDLSVIRVNCSKCKCLVNELDWDNESLVDYVFSVFGSMDDYYFFPCECGEINAYHYTAYDCLIEEYEYLHGMYSNDITSKLVHAGSWVLVRNQEISNFELLTSFENGNCETSIYRNGFNFYKVDYNCVHKCTEVFEFRVNESNLIELLEYFRKEVN